MFMAQLTTASPHLCVFTTGYRLLTLATDSWRAMAEENTVFPVFLAPFFRVVYTFSVEETVSKFFECLQDVVYIVIQSLKSYLHIESLPGVIRQI